MSTIPNEENIDSDFINRVINTVTVSCALPFQIPIEHVERLIREAAQFFWENDNSSMERRVYNIRNTDLNKENAATKLILLPEQIYSVYGVYRGSGYAHGVLDDFSVEKIMLSQYSVFGGARDDSRIGPVDMVMSMYELSTYENLFNSAITYDFNRFSHQLNIIGDIGYDDLVIKAFVRCRVQDLYNNYYFLKYVTALCQRALSTIYGTLSFKMPGGVEINYDKFEESANNEIDKIEEALKNRSGVGFFLTSTSN